MQRGNCVSFIFVTCCVLSFIFVSSCILDKVSNWGLRGLVDSEQLFPRRLDPQQIIFKNKKKSIEMSYKQTLFQISSFHVDRKDLQSFYFFLRSLDILVTLYIYSLAKDGEEFG